MLNLIRREVIVTIDSVLSVETFASRLLDVFVRTFGLCAQGGGVVDSGGWSREGVSKKRQDMC